MFFFHLRLATPRVLPHVLVLPRLRTACVECPEGASCEGTNVPLALPDFWRAPESTTAFFNCPEGYCEGEVHALQAEIQGTRAPPPPGGVPPARRHARARQLQQLNGTRPTLPAPAFFVDKNGLLTVDALQYLSQGGDCREGHWGPLCAVRDDAPTRLGLHRISHRASVRLIGARAARLVARSLE